MAGLLTNLRDRFRSLYAALLAPPSPAERTREKVASDQRGIIRPQFLPYHNDTTGETLGMRRQYRVMVTDPNIKPALFGKILSVAALDASFAPGDEDDAENKRQTAFCDWQFMERIAGGIPEIVWSIFSGGLIDGYSVCEPKWEVEVGGDWNGKHAIDQIKPLQVDDDVILIADEHKNVVGVQGQKHNAGLVWRPEHFVIWRNLGLYGAPTGMSDLRAAYGRYWILDTAIKFRAIGAEKRAFPVVVGHYEDDGDKAGLDEALASIKWSNYLSAPTTAQVEALNIAGSGDQYFRDLIKDLREEIVLSITGAVLQMLTAQEGVQRGNSETHKGEASLFRWWLQQSLTQIFNGRNGLIRRVLEPNFPLLRKPPKFALGGVDEEELGRMLTVDLGLQQMGWVHSRKALEKKYGRAWAKDEQDAVRPAQPAMPMPGAMPFDEGDDPPAGPAVPASAPFRFSEGWQPGNFQWTED